jgi:hypothetical protein
LQLFFLPHGATAAESRSGRSPALSFATVYQHLPGFTTRALPGEKYHPPLAAFSG